MGADGDSEASYFSPKFRSNTVCTYKFTVKFTEVLLEVDTDTSNDSSSWVPSIPLRSGVWQMVRVTELYMGPLGGSCCQGICQERTAFFCLTTTSKGSSGRASSLFDCARSAPPSGTPWLGTTYSTISSDVAFTEEDTGRPISPRITLGCRFGFVFSAETAEHNRTSQKLVLNGVMIHSLSFRPAPPSHRLLGELPTFKSVTQCHSYVCS